MTPADAKPSAAIKFLPACRLNMTNFGLLNRKQINACSELKYTSFSVINQFNDQKKSFIWSSDMD